MSSPSNSSTRAVVAAYRSCGLVVREVTFVIQRVCHVLTAAVAVGAAALLVAFVGVRLIGLTPYAVLSGSMEPVYPVGSLLYVQDARPADVEVGDAITFALDSGTLVTHEVYQIDAKAQQFYTQGIANINPDGSVVHDAAPVAFDRVVGVPVACIPQLGYLNAFLTGPAGVFAVVAVFGVVIILQIAASLASGRGSVATAGSPASTGSHFRT